MKGKKMKGELPVPYIVAIVIAIIVIALLVVFFLLYYNQSTNVSSETICRTKEVSYCTQWAMTGYDTDKQPGSKAFSEWAADCASYSWAKSVSMTACKALLNPLPTS
jgi:hypothetical protein